jgi:hypothetical protein
VYSEARHDPPTLLLAAAGNPAVDQICGIAASPEYVWIAFTAFINGRLKPAVTLFGGMNTKTRLFEPINGYNLDYLALNFYCQPQSRPLTVGNDGFVYMKTNGGYSSVFQATLPPAIVRFNASMKLNPFASVTYNSDGTVASATFSSWPFDPQVGYSRSYFLYPYFSSYPTLSQEDKAGFARDVAAIDGKVYLSIFQPDYVCQVIYWYKFSDGLDPSNPAKLILLSAVPEYNGFYDIFTNGLDVSMQLVAGYKPSTLYAMFAGSSIMYNVSKPTFISKTPVDKWSNNKTYPYVWKNATIGWRVGTCNDVLVNSSKIVPGYGIPPAFSDLCRSVNS